jgi:hypothetical protein
LRRAALVSFVGEKEEGPVSGVVDARNVDGPLTLAPGEWRTNDWRVSENGRLVFAEVLTWIVPQSELIFYKEGDTILFDEWLSTVPVKVQLKCISLVGLLRSRGHELRRPIADFLRDGIYELRPTSYQGINYRILYFFSGKNIVVISHGISKKSEVPAIEIDRAIERKRKYEANPKVHGVKGQQ